MSEGLVRSKSGGMDAFYAVVAHCARRSGQKASLIVVIAKDEMTSSNGSRKLEVTVEYFQRWSREEGGGDN
jgi:hypothetical protein